jgi:putative peptidoglycan lipid II flippase
MVCTPRQVSADVSSALDSVIIRALLQRPTRQGQPIQSPAEFADQLAAVAPPAPLPEPAPPTANYGYGGYGPDPNNPDSWGTGDRGPSGTAPYGPPSSSQYPAAGYGAPQYTGQQYAAPGYPGGPGPQGKQRRGGRGPLVVVVVLVLVAVAAVVWAVGFRNSGSPSTAGGGSAPSTSTSAPASATLKPAGAVTFNPYGKPAGNTENQVTVQGAIDNNPSTSWQTSVYYDRPNMGGLKPGTGLLIDLGKQVKLSQIEVTFSTAGGPTTASVYLGNNPTDTNAAGLSNFTLVSPSVSASGDHKFSVSSQATGRYVLIWLTNLPKLSNPPPGVQPGHTYYEGQIYNVVVSGSAASGNS